MHYPAAAAPLGGKINICNMRKHFKYTLVLLLAMMASFSAKGQFFTAGDDPAKARWRQIKTEHYTFIYPQEIDSLARLYATYFETNRDKVMEPLQIAPRRIPVVLHPYYTRSNGVVTWAPKRVDLYTTPPAYEGTSESWIDNLSKHEGRHVGQVSHFEKKGVYKVLYPLIGEQSTGIGVGLYPSKLFLEGDAVIAETELGNAGRGRNADFLMYSRAAYLNGDFRNWDKQRFGSYKYYTPNEYVMGYILNSSIRAKTENYTYPGQYLDYEVKHFYNPGIIFAAYKNVVNNTRYAFYQEGQQMMAEIWKKDVENMGPVTPSEDIAVKRERLYSDYRYPIYVDFPGSKFHKRVIGVKNGMEDAHILVSVDSLGKERTIRPFNHYHSPLAYSPKGMIYWTESIHTSGDALRDYSVVVSLDLKDGSTQIINKKTRFFNPAVSPDGEIIAVAEYPETGSSNLILLSAKHQFITKQYKAPDNGQIKEIAFVGDDIYCSAIVGDGLGLFKLDSSNGSWENIIPVQHQTLVGMKVDGDNIYFTSDLSGVNNIYTFDTKANKLYKLTNAIYGASDGFIPDSERSLYYSEYDQMGYRFVKAPLDSMKWEVSSFDNPYRHPIAETLAKQSMELSNIERIDTVDVTDIEKYPSKKYSKVGNFFRFHSWAPVYYNIDKIKSMSFQNFYEAVSLGATAYSQNTLGTAVSMFGYSYHNGFHSGHAKISYSGLPVTIELSADFNDRNREDVALKHDEENNKYYVDSKSREKSPYLLASALVYYPWNLSRKGWNTGLIPQVQWMFSNDRYYSYAEQKYTFRNQVNYGATFYQTRPIPKSAIFPRWGYGLNIMGGSAPWSYENYGSIAYLNGYFYLPGITKQQGLKLTATWQKQFVDGKYFYLSSFASMPRGLEDITPTQNFIKGTIDYAIPVYLGDFSLSTILYVQRMQLIPFFDYAIDAVPDYYSHKYSSVGTDLLFDFFFLRIGVPLSMGVRYAYTNTPDKSGHYFKFLFNLKLPQ